MVQRFEYWNMAMDIILTMGICFEFLAAFLQLARATLFTDRFILITGKESEYHVMLDDNPIFSRVMKSHMLTKLAYSYGSNLLPQN